MVKISKDKVSSDVAMAVLDDLVRRDTPIPCRIQHCSGVLEGTSYYACPVCGREVDPSYGFCPRCGQRLVF